MSEQRNGTSKIRDNTYFQMINITKFLSVKIYICHHSEENRVIIIKS
jgi:hypothetical protein